MAIEPPWLWLCAGLLLAIFELLVPGVFLIWIGGAAVLTGLLTLASGVALPVQIGLFTVTALALVTAARNWVRRNPDQGDPLLNDRAARLLGRAVRVVEPVDANRGRVAVDDGTWPAEGGPAPTGSWVRIVDWRDGRAVVVPVEPDTPTLPAID